MRRAQAEIRQLQRILGKQAMLNREFEKKSVPKVNPKRIYRIMKQAGLLLERHTGKLTRTHDGTIITLKPNLRWCSDTLQIRCCNGEKVEMAFVLDCCDREAMRFGLRRRDR